MEPKESLEIRQQMAEMHDAVLERINNAYKNNQYIEVCWLCYACFESRVNRILLKINSGCIKSKRKSNRKVGITTKLNCYACLIKNEYPPLQNENRELINTVKGWCKERNNLINGLVTLEYYNDADKQFKSLAKRGKDLVNRMYLLGKDVREYYYSAEEIPLFPEDALNKCKLLYKCIKE